MYTMILGANQYKLMREYCDYHHIKYNVIDKGQDEYHIDINSEEDKDRILGIFK